MISNVLREGMKIDIHIVNQTEGQNLQKRLHQFTRVRFLNCLKMVKWR